MVDAWTRGRTTLVASLTVIGFVLTATNGVLAYRSSARRLRLLGRRITASDRYALEEQGAPGAPTAACDHEPKHTAHEQADLVLHALQASRANLVLAGVGLLISAAAGVWALYP